MPTSSMRPLKTDLDFFQIHSRDDLGRFEHSCTLKYILIAFIKLQFPHYDSTSIKIFKLIASRLV